MLKPEFSGQFKRDYKLAIKRGCDPKKLDDIFKIPFFAFLCYTLSKYAKGMINRK